jgi:hypothetical protein
MLEIVNAVLPLFVSVTVCDAVVLPTCALPNTSFVGEGLMTAAGLWLIRAVTSPPAEFPTSKSNFPPVLKTAATATGVTPTL